MSRTLRIAVGIGALSVGAWLLMAAEPPPIESKEVPAFIERMVKEHGFDRDSLTKVLDEARFNQRIIEVISKPAESKPWYEYRPIFLNPARIHGGVEYWNENAETLNRAEAVYGVPPEIVAAILGVETRYGTHAGSFRVLDSLATLAFAYPPRQEFFRSELEQYLLLVREEDMDPTAAKGSYAGAMGQPQFMPSSFRSYAVDFDNDGKRDIWNSTADSIGSVANYLSRHGWRRGEPVAGRISVNGGGFKQLLARGIKPNTPLAEFPRHGIDLAKPFPADMLGAVIELEADADNGTEYWVGLQNFYTITRYNHSELYAMAVYQLSEEIKAQHR